MSNRSADTPGQDNGSARPSRLPAALSSFRHRNFRLWFAGQLVSMIGTWMQIIAQGWLVYQISHSELVLGIYGFASAIPILVISPWAGVLADRLPRRRLLLATQTAFMLSAFALAALTLSNLVQVWHIILFGMLQGVINAFDTPARLSFGLDMVGREDLPNSIALGATMFNGARVIGPAIGGYLLAAFGAGWCFFINGVSFMAVIGGLFFMRFPVLPRRPTKGNPMREILAGLTYVRGRRDILAILGLTVIFGVLGTAYSSQLPAFVTSVLGADETGFGAVNTAVGLGALVGGIVLAQYGTRLPRGRLVTVTALLYPLALGAFAFIPTLTPALPLAFLLGLGFLLLFNNFNSLLQLNTSDEMRGRVMSLYSLVFFGFSPFGALLIGAVAESLPLPLTIGLSAALTLILTLAVLFAVPEIRKV
jgi:MFS family permease